MSELSCSTCLAECDRVGKALPACKDHESNGKQHSKIRRVYIAGPMSAMPADYLAYCARMLVVYKSLMEHGFVAFCPACDMLLGLVCCEPIPVEHYRAASMAWLEVCDVVLCIGTHHADGRVSDGVSAEIDRAIELHIPIVYSMDDLLRLRGSEP